jgi:hypothetical protein
MLWSFFWKFGMLNLFRRRVAIYSGSGTSVSGFSGSLGR